MLLIDSHTHLYLPEFDEDRDSVLARALDEGVSRLFLPNIDCSTLNDMLALSENYPENCFPMIGLHPCSVNKDYEHELEAVESNLCGGSHKFYALGEIGIDLYRNRSFLHQQKDAFKRQVVLAKKHKLPVVIHQRESFDEIMTIIESLNDDDLTGIFHCFTGTVEQAGKITSLGGFKLGIGGVVTYKNSTLKSVVEQIDLRNIVLETDSPYLAPVPKRGKRNESSFLVYVARKIAEIRQSGLEKIAAITTQNALQVFGN